MIIVMKIDKITSKLLIILSFLSLNSKSQECASNYANPWEWDHMGHGLQEKGFL